MFCVCVCVFDRFQILPSGKNVWACIQDISICFRILIPLAFSLKEAFLAFQVGGT